MATSKKKAPIRKTADTHKGVLGTLHCRQVISRINSVSITNDVGGTTSLPEGDYRVRLRKSWYDYETGVRCTGELLEVRDIEKARHAGTTGYTPKDYRKYGGSHYQRVRRAARAFDPSHVYFHDVDFTPDAHE